MTSKRKLLTRIAEALERQVAVMERAEARINQEIADAKAIQAERIAAIKKVFGDMQVIPGEHPDEMLMLDPDGDLDPNKRKH
jgi:hypothetical protein